MFSNPEYWVLFDFRTAPSFFIRMNFRGFYHLKIPIGAWPCLINCWSFHHRRWSLNSGPVFRTFNSSTFSSVFAIHAHNETHFLLVSFRLNITRVFLARMRIRRILNRRSNFGHPFGRMSLSISQDGDQIGEPSWIHRRTFFGIVGSKIGSIN